MPKYHKTEKFELWREGETYQDSAGGWHSGRPTQVATFWGNLKGTDYSLLYQTQGVWAKPTFEITLTRGKFTVPRIGDHIRHEGRFYVIRQVNDLTGQVGRDMRITCEHDNNYRSPQ